LTGNIDPASVLSKMTLNTRAIVAVHFGGYPAELRALRMIANDFGAVIVEDCAHAFGAEFRDWRIGAAFGDFRCFSFQAIKTLTTIDGGALICSNEADYKRAKLLRWYGMDREDKARLELRCESDVKEHGYKFHMADPAAVIGMANLKSVDARVARARMNAAWYDAEFFHRSIERCWMTEREADRRSSYWLYPIGVDDPAQFIPFMKSRGVHASQVHVRNDVHTLFAASRTSLPGVDTWSAHNVSIPVGAWVSDVDRMTVMDAIEEYDHL
jgi:dTDP-4-amino-4,6-dideoxygalactose transaminase